MPYRKSYRRRKKYYKRKKSAKALAISALKKVNAINRNIETKFLDTTVFNSNVNWEGSIVTLNDIAQGLTDSNRIGDKVVIKYIKFKMFYTLNGADNTALRVIFFNDKENTFISPSQILTENGSGFPPLSDYVKDTRGKLKVCWDKLYYMSSAERTCMTRKGHLNCRIPTTFSAGSTIIEKGALKLFFVSNIDNLDAAQPNIRFYIRIYYSDL